MADMRRRRSQRARRIGAVLAALVIVGLGLARWQGGVSPAGSAIRRVASVERDAPASPPEPARQPEHRASSSASPVGPSPSGARPVAVGAAAPVFDLATLARNGAPEPSPDGDRFRTNEKFTADDLAHPERYFEAAEHLPELRRDEERHDVLEYFVAYRARLERDLVAAGGDGDKRAAVRAAIARYDAAIARLRSALATSAP